MSQRSVTVASGPKSIARRPTCSGAAPDAEPYLNPFAADGFVKPVLADGRGGSFIIFAEKTADGFVVTTLNGEGVTLDELRKVAEGLSR
jgi:hypothetical protein